MSLKNSFFLLYLSWVLVGITTTELKARFFRRHQETNAETAVPQDIFKLMLLLDTSKITSACIERIKNTLEHNCRGLKITISDAGELTHEPFKIIIMANTGETDMVIYLTCAVAQIAQSAIYLYRYSWGQEFVKLLRQSAWYTLDQAYICSKDTSALWANKLKDFLNGPPYKENFYIRGVFAMPFKPLLGIKIPAFGVEIVSNNTNDWDFFAAALATGIETLVQPLIEQRCHVVSL